ncbi:MAG: helix-turn-helix domain-containing protein [Thermomicrobiales bacterium]|nr:helix-turn-helix domain-containing protein [Thermomicrobiales bacterium]
MEAVSGEITLYDLIAWEPRIRSIAPSPESPHWHPLTTLDVDWVVTARSSQPMLPTLRGGELIILPDRIVREIGVGFSALVRELASQSIAGVLTDFRGEIDADSAVAVLQIPSFDNDLERDLNRLLTNGRRQALQRVAELDQTIAEAGARGSRPSELVDKLSQTLGLPITVHTPGSTSLFTTASSRDLPTANSDAWVRSSLRNGYTVWLGPIPPARHALARFSLQHVRDALQRALDSTATMAPRGNARAAALNELLLEPIGTDRERIARKAMNAGVPPDRSLRVAISSNDMPEATIRRSLQQLGDVLEAGELGEHRLWLVASRATIPAQGRLGTPGKGWLALSTAMNSAGDLPEATRQARYVAQLMHRGLIPIGATAFDDAMTLGVYGLLYDDWESDLQRAYRDRHLGPLLTNDPRGLLMETLGVYLDQQGSQSHAADELGIHRNTLSYRLRQIESALPADLYDPGTRLTLLVAIAIHRMLKV